MKTEQARQLWQRARMEGDGGPAAEEIDPLHLAAYLDGRLEDEAMERLEAQLASSAGALELLIAARAGLDATPTALPRRALERAKAVVAAGIEETDDSPWALLVRRLTGPWRPYAAAGAAALYLAVCVATFDLGRRGAEDVLALADGEPALAYTLTLDDVL